MKKLLCALMLFLLAGLPLQTLAAEAEQTTTVRTTINAPKASELDDLITKEKEKQREKNDYTDDSWNKYQDALKKAEDVLKNTPYDEEKVNAALENLQQAINGLVLKKKAGTTAGGSTSPGNTVKSGVTAAAKSYPRTGMIAGSSLLIVGIAAVATALSSWGKQKK